MTSATDTPADPAVFEDTDRHEITLTEDDLLGTHVYENVLYTGAEVDRARDFAEQTSADGDAPRIAKATTPEQRFETGDAYVSSVFCNYAITGGMGWHLAFLRAWRSDAYHVAHDADYETGTLTITVKRENTPRDG